MARSRRRTPIFGNAKADSDKPYKVAEHRRERRQVRAKLADDEERVPAPKAFGDPWKSDKDGKRFWRGAPVDAMRK